jgi:hypothetical protein
MVGTRSCYEEIGDMSGRRRAEASQRSARRGGKNIRPETGTVGFVGVGPGIGRLAAEDMWSCCCIAVTIARVGAAGRRSIWPRIGWFDCLDCIASFGRMWGEAYWRRLRGCSV